MLEERIVDHNTFQISSHVTEWRCNEEPKWQACVINYYSIRTCDNLMKARQKTFHTLHTFAEYKAEEEPFISE